MRAWRVHEHGAPREVLRLETAPVPEPPAGHVRIAVAAAALNLPDDRLCRGIYALRPDLPFTPGLEAAGLVDAVGAGVQVPLGSRVVAVATLPHGSLAEFAIAPEAGLYPVPESMTFAEAAAFLIAFQTGHVALHRRARLAAGETLLVHAGAGGVGSAAIQLGVAAGATVIATAGGPEKVARCRALGAHHAIDYRGEDFIARVLELTDGRGADVVYDPVGGDVLHGSRRCIANEGRLLIVGFAAGEPEKVPTNQILMRNYSVVGVYMGAYSKSDTGRAFVHAVHRELLDLFEAGTVAPVIDRVVPFAAVPAAIDDIAQRRTTGKVVVRVGADGPQG
jgi:NADPH2:quinone reductase